MYEPTAYESTGAPASLKKTIRSGSKPAADDDPHVAVTGLVETRTHLPDELGRDAATLGWRVQSDAVEPVTECVGDAQRLLRLVPESVDEDDARHIRRHVAVESLRRADRVAEDEHQRVRHRARGARPARRAPAGVDAPTQPPMIAA